MTIPPKDLNQTNSGYGFKQMRHAWEANLSILGRLQENYNLGAYDRVIRDGVEHISGMRIKSIADLPKMTEGDLAHFYYLGKSYLAMGQMEEALACFHIVYSQHGFGKRMLTSPMNFRDLAYLAGNELQEIATERGESYVNNVQVDEFMGRTLKGGCFIATAVYGTPLAPELLFLRRFRDEILQGSRLGSAFVKAYYVVSPPLATAIARSAYCKKLVMTIIFAPLLSILKLRESRTRYDGVE